MTKVLLVVNPSSGGEKAKSYQQLAQEQLGQLFDEVKTVLTEQAGDATTFAKEAAAEGYDAFFVMGGDGTVNEGISGLAEQKQPPKFGFFPLGTVNDLARALGISLDPESAIKAVTQYKVRAVDIGKINQDYFMNVVALGEIPEAINQVGVAEKTKLGQLAYFWSGLKSFLGNQAYEFELELDGQKQQLTSSTLIIGLTNSIGGFEELLPAAAVDDGLLHLIYLKDQSKIDTVKAVPQLLKGVEGSSEHLGYLTFKTGEIRLKEPQTGPLYANVDGDQGAALPLTFQVLPGQLHIYCPVHDPQ